MCLRVFPVQKWGRMLKTFVMSLIVSSISLWCVEARANVVYNFKVLSNLWNVTGSVSFTVPDFISSNAVVTPDQFYSSSVAGPFPNLSLGDMQFKFDFFQGYDMVSFKVFFSPDTYVNSYYYFKPGTFGAFGSYGSELHSDVMPQDAHLDIYEALPSVRIGGPNPIYFVPPTLQNTYGNTLSGTVIEMKSGVLDATDTLIANDISGKVVTLKGGFDADFISDNGMTNMTGPLIIRTGTVRIERVNIQ